MSESIPEFVDKLQIVSLTDALFMLNGAIDAGRSEGVTLQEVHEHLEEGDLFEHLEQRLGVGDSIMARAFERGKLPA